MADLIQPDVSVFRTISGPLLAPQTPADWQEQATRAQTAQAIAQEQRARAQAAAEDRATKARKAAEEQADAQLLQQLAQKHRGDPDLMLTELRAVNPRVAMKFDADWTDVKKKNIDLVTADNKNQREKLGKHMGLLKLLEQRPDLYPVVKATIDKEDPSMSPYLPAEYDPAKIAPLFQMAHTAESILETDKLALQYLVEGKWHQAVAMAFADKTMGPEQVAQKAAELIQMRVPRQVVDSFDWQHWTPDFAARALERGRTPDQRADAAARAAEHADTVAHQRATEATAAAQLGISRGNLGVAQANLGLRRQELAKGGSDNSPLQAVIGPDGQPVLVRRDDAVGKRPATGTATAAGAKGGPDVGAIMGEIGKLSKKINTSSGGPMANLGGYMRRGLSKANWDNEVSQYESLVSGMIPMVARAVGHTGVLTQQDVDSVRAMFPKVGDNEALAAEKMATVNRLIGSGAAAPAAPAATTTQGAPKTRPPAVGDIVRHNGKRYRVTSISNGNADLEAVP